MYFEKNIKMNQTSINKQRLPISNKRKRNIFTEEEDHLIYVYVNLFGTKKWDIISKYIPGRTSKQCRDRYMNHLRPGISLAEWTQEEDELLIQMYLQYGPHWSIINKSFENRNQLSLKNRFLFIQKQQLYNNKVPHIMNNLNILSNQTVKYPKLNFKINEELDFAVDNSNYSCSNEKISFDFLFEKLFNDKFYPLFYKNFDLFE